MTNEECTTRIIELNALVISLQKAVLDLQKVVEQHICEHIVEMQENQNEGA